MRLQAARTKLREVIKQAGKDTPYMKQLRDDPVRVLLKEGFPNDVIEDFLRETEWQAEAYGYTLIECANSCALTRLSDYPELF